jgi:hypothetical protein
MNREEIQRLLGGYATGTLTPEEQQALFAAALEDQELFDALGREQVLRDLLRDPAARAEALAALDAPAAGRVGWLAWLQRPVMVGFAAAGLAAVAVLAVWQGTRVKPMAQVPAILAEMKGPEASAPEVAPVEPPQVLMKQKTAPRESHNANEVKLRESVKREDARQENTGKDIAAALNAPLPAAAPPPPAPPPPPLPAAATPAPAPISGNAAVMEVTPAKPVEPAKALARSVQLGALQDKITPENLTLDARSLFYGNAFVRRDSALTEPLAAGTAGASSSKPTFASVRAATGSVAKKEGAAASLGVRVSLLRGDEEVAVATILNPGESVRLKVTPNENGFLYVAARDGNVWKMVASSPAQRLKPFETPPLGFEGSGQKQLYVMLSRQPQTLSPQSLAGLVRANLVQTPAELDRATYAVAGLQNSTPQQVVQPITLTFR